MAANSAPLDGQLATDRSWAPELFVGADAILSGVKQIHVEVQDALIFLARDLETCDTRRFSILTPQRREATVEVSYSVIEQTVDAIGFFAFVWATLHTGGALLASGARVLVSANTWTPDKRKSFSPWRSIDRMITTLVPPRPDAAEHLRALVFEALGATPRSRVLVPALARGYTGGSGRYDPRIDVAIVRGGFAASGGSATKVWLDRFFRSDPQIAVHLATLYARYAQQAGFHTWEPASTLR